MPDFLNLAYLSIKKSFWILNKFNRRSKMKKLFILGVFLLLSTSVFAQYPEVTIMEIQYQDPAGLLVYFENDSASAYEGDTVTVTGMVMVPPNIDADPANGPLMYFGSLRGFYMQDTSATEWAGLLVLQEPPISPELEILDSGTVVRVTGVVSEYDDGNQKTTELFLISFDGSNIIGFRDKPEPIVLTLDSLKETGTNTSKGIAEKWEGSYIMFRDVTVFEHFSGGGFRISDDNSTQFNIYTRSNNYYGHTPPPLGSRLEYIRGFVETRSENVGGVSINPAFPEDVKILSLPANISNVTRNRVEVHSGETVTITANIVDPDGNVTDAKLFYRENRGPAHTELTMNNTGGDTYQTIIPAFNDSTFIDFFVRAVDDSNNVSLNPADTARNRYFYMVLDRPLTIQDVQYNPFGGDSSGYNRYEISVRGIVTADTTDLEGDGSAIGPKVYIQNGTGPWSGIWVSGTETLLRRRGDDITVTGTVEENYLVTRISGIDDPGNIQVHATGQPVPEPEVLSTATIDLLSSGSVQAEQWESVLIKYEDIEVTDENADGSPGPGGGGNSNFGEMLVSDASTQVTRVELQDGTHHYHNFWAAGLDTIPGNVRIKTGDTFDGLIGILYFSFNNYKLTPRKDDDFIGFVSDISNELDMPNEFRLTQNYPNPFNPSTKINYMLPVEANVTLKIFNILGQEVMTLINNELIAAGNHEISFNANGLPTGIYIYSFRANDFVQTKKMLLLK